MTPKQIIVMRKDLNMRKGKMAAQAAHASMKVLLDQMEWEYPKNADPKLLLHVKENSHLYLWITGLFTKICVSVDSEQELMEIYQKAKDAGILCSLIEDAGLTEFNGVPTKTCIAIGPEDPEKLAPLTGHLKLL